MAITPLTLAGGAIGLSGFDGGGSAAAPHIWSRGNGAEQAMVATHADGAAPRTNPMVNRAGDGLFHAMVTVGGTQVPMIVDTGATRSILSTRALTAQQLARISPATVGTMHTLNGTARYRETAPLTVQVGTRELPNIRIAVMDTPGGISVLGHDVMGRLGPITMDGDRLTLP
ncbi:MAG: TIGR02281 family clan AA aspartic protease [Sphingopyxis sp.]